MRKKVALTITSLGFAILTAAFLPQLRSAALAVWDLGDVFAAVASGSYQVYSNGGTFKETVSDGFSGFTTGCAFNTDRTKLYTTNFTNSRVVKYDDADPHTTSSFVTAGQSSPESIVFKMSGGYFVGAPSTAIIVEYDASDNLVTTHAVAPNDGTGGTDWIDLAANQTTLFYTAEGRLIKRFDTAGGQLPDFATLPGSGNAYAFRLLSPFDGSGGLIVADGNDIKRLDGSGNVIQTYSVTGVNGFFGLNLDPDGTSFWTGSFTNGVLYRFNIATGGVNNPIQMIDTGRGGNTLFGVCLKGELTGGGPGPTPPPSHVPELAVSVSPRKISRGQNATFVVTDVHGPVDVPVTVFYRVGGSARLNRDYTLSGTFGEITIPAGESSGSVVLHALKRGPKNVVLTVVDSPTYVVSPLFGSARVNIRR